MVVRVHCGGIGNPCEDGPVTTETRSTARRRVVATSWVLILATYPVVWAIGYQDHPWRNGLVSVVVASVALVVALILKSASEGTEPSAPRWVGWLAVIVTSAALASALIWAFFDSSLAGPID